MWDHGYDVILEGTHFENCVCVVCGFRPWKQEHKCSFENLKRTIIVELGPSCLCYYGQCFFKTIFEIEEVTTHDHLGQSWFVESKPWNNYMFVFLPPLFGCELQNKVPKGDNDW